MSGVGVGFDWGIVLCALDEVDEDGDAEEARELEGAQAWDEFVGIDFGEGVFEFFEGFVGEDAVALVDASGDAFGGFALELVSLEGDVELGFDEEAEVEEVEGVGAEVIHEEAFHLDGIGGGAGDLADEGDELLEYFVFGHHVSPELQDFFEGFSRWGGRVFVGEAEG